MKLIERAAQLSGITITESKVVVELDEAKKKKKSCKCGMTVKDCKCKPAKKQLGEAHVTEGKFIELDPTEFIDMEDVWVAIEEQMIKKYGQEFSDSIRDSDDMTEIASRVQNKLFPGWNDGPKKIELN